MKILMVIKKLHYSGAPKMFLWVAKSLANKGHEVRILTYLSTDNLEFSIPPNVTWIKKELNNSSLYKRYKELRKEINQWQPDCSISFLLDANILNILACKGLHTKSIVCERNDPYKPHYYKLKILYPIFHWADGAVFQLEKVQKYYDNIKANTAVIPNPVINNGSTEELLSFEQRENVIATLSRLDLVQKRLDILIYAFKQFLEIHPEYILKIYGSGPDRNKIETLIRKLHLQHKILLPGVATSPNEVLRNVKMFVLTSDFEGIPNALIEAMSLGLPCISTDCSPGGAALLIQNKKNGLLTPRADIKSLVESMDYLASNPHEADTISLRAKEIITTFSEKKIINKWEEYLYKITK